MMSGMVLLMMKYAHGQRRSSAALPAMLKITIQTTTIQIQTRRRTSAGGRHNDDTRTMNQVKIHQSHKIPTYITRRE
jgi:hypothetical protein